MTVIYHKLYFTYHSTSESELLLVYNDLTDIVLFDEVLDDQLSVVVNTFPFVQFVQVSSPHFKHKVLRELIGTWFGGDLIGFTRSI